MTRKEKEVRNEQMRQYKAEGHSMSEVAEKFNLSEGTAQLICKGIAPQYRPCKIYRNQYTSNKFDRLANCLKIIETANSDFEYVDGFTDADGKVNLRCKKCGYEFERSLISLRHHNRKHICPECKRIEKDKEKAIKKDIIRKQREKQREEKRQLKKKFYQSEMGVCKVCNSIFVKQTSRQKYCSEYCRNHNKWMMKDKYRYLFPLEEVYQRDNGICYLCGKQCDWNDKKVVNGTIVYGNYYPSRDHIIPKSKGGTNSWENIRLAHRICNSVKKDIPLV